MGVLGKDLLDYTRPLPHVKVQFGAKKYWIEEETVGISYGTILVQALNTDPAALNLNTFFPFVCSFEELTLIQKQYAWFIEEALDDGGQRRKKGQMKLPAADRILKNAMEAFVSGRSLSSDPEVDAPNVQIQYAVLETKDGAEVVEKIYFDSLLDFVYVEFMKALQKGFIPKRCPNCGDWFVQEPGMDFNYCANPSPQDPTKLCRDIGARSNFIEKKKNHGLWNIHQRAYRKYYARMKKGNMERNAFFVWAEEAAKLRDELLPKYDAVDYETRSDMEEKYRKEVNKL